jgi:hypothetical protein
MHRSLWLNDPDCLMLRTSDTELTETQMRTWAHAVAMSGGMALVSDDLALLGEEERRLLDEVIAIGQEVDQAAIAGSPPHPGDLLESEPRTLTAAGKILEVTPKTGESTLSETN